MPPKVKNLTDILPPELQEATAQPLDDWLDTPLVFHGCRGLQGTNGTYRRITVSQPDDDKQFIIQTGASQPMAVLDWAENNRAFPFAGRFVRVDRAIILKGID